MHAKPNAIRIAALMLLCGAVVIFVSCKEEESPAADSQQNVPVTVDIEKGTMMPEQIEKIEKTPEQWKQELTDKQYHILRESGTERAFDNPYHDYKGKGVYVCAGCGLALFDSDAKFDSGTGWPSYYKPHKDEYVETRPDNKLFIRRTEVLCARCEGHLGHVFKDGPKPTGLRYCINSAALNFVPEEKTGDE